MDWMIYKARHVVENTFASLYAILCKLPSSQMAAQAVIKVYRKPIHGQSPILNRQVLSH